VSSDAYHHEDALSLLRDPFHIMQGDCFKSDTGAVYRVRVIEGGFALVEDLNASTVYFDHPRKWVSLGALTALKPVIV